MSKNVKIIVAVACLALAIGIFCFTSGLFSGGGGGGSGDGKIWFKCVNPDCNQPYSLTPEEFAKTQGDNPMMMMPMMMPGQQQAFKCQKCSQQSAYMAQKCEKKECGEVFIMQMPMPGQENQDFPDRCPKCGYSASEESEKQQK
jgi:hypothetical protein